MIILFIIAIINFFLLTVNFVGALGSQLPSQTFGNSTLSGFNNSGLANIGSNLFSSPAILTNFPPTDASSTIFSSSSNLSAGEQIASNAQLV